ncbi:hypothetical protein IQ250_07175 [Pseudanabaenaceae cyanobacterium LEGE 13415]|nr:hypothetical protein [Pseudanabaenaceae cyanobacterium LEGE 13415]
MTNPNQGDRYDRTNPPAENQPNPDGYGSGYTQGRAVERQRYESVQQVRDENNTANGFLIGILLTGVVLGGAALAYFMTQRDRTPAPVQRTIVVPSTAPSPSPSPEVRERVIERDRIVPVPQPQQSSPTVVPAPTIRIEAPKPAPAAPASQSAPTTPSNPQTQSSTERSSSAQPSPSPEATTTPNSTSPNSSSTSGQ